MGLESGIKPFFVHHVDVAALGLAILCVRLL